MMDEPNYEIDQCDHCCVPLPHGGQERYAPWEVDHECDGWVLLCAACAARFDRTANVDQI